MGAVAERTDASRGAETRLTQYGPNEMEEKKTNPLLKFLCYFWGPIPWMIEAAVILSAVVRHWPDFVIILVLLVANAVVGFWEEHQAGNAIAALKAKLALRAQVKRDGKWVTRGARAGARRRHPSAPGRHRAGRCASAGRRPGGGGPIGTDRRVAAGHPQAGEAVYSGSIIRTGEIDALVYATGGTPFSARPPNWCRRRTRQPLSARRAEDRQLPDRPGGRAGGGDPPRRAVSRRPDLTTLQFALVLTVAAIPVAMPTVLSVTMAVGARMLAGKEAIVSRLAAIEELAGMDVLCSDKTGTLTQNKLTLGDPFSVTGSRPTSDPCAALASRADNQDTIDLAVLGGLKDTQP